MKHLVPMVVALSIGTPGAVIAATSGSIDGEMTIPYSCAITVPAIKQLVISGASATATDTWTFVQNDQTVYTMSTVSFQDKPSTASVVGSIDLTYGGGTYASAFDLAATTSGGAQETVAGNMGSATPGVVTYTITETATPNFYAGDYNMVTTLTCAQALSESNTAYDYSTYFSNYTALGNGFTPSNNSANGSGYTIQDTVLAGNPLQTTYGVVSTWAGTEDSNVPGYSLSFATEAQRIAFQARIKGAYISTPSGVSGQFTAEQLTITGSGTGLVINAVEGTAMSTDLYTGIVSNGGVNAYGVGIYID